ncbi:Serine/threonine protein kinase [Actinopolyspora lacussalsi subsp. righensis]|uniref:non-specific serine/threonine protein kinase n=1 Tax=Actinopolyspora righensis TaxID=995060 RepID=A0A1I6YCP1_9ACTN|nr:serine/threonine-protein kinase [Actinopolyspora righensis]SFT48081.1 Serine/threonine protein kinase [Actinopolyspora righensis]
MPEEEPEESGIGRLIADRYRMRARIGGGAMGSVWSGMDELLRRPVAIKAVRLPPGIPEAEAAEIRERTLREARATAVVVHPNVVTLYDVAREGDEPFVVMELVPSHSLASIIADHGPMDDGQLAVVIDSVASALETAHQAGVVHRDVKPGNILLAADGRIKLSDFGISRNVAEPTLTRTGIMLGTPAFIAPEVAAGETVTAAADLWGLGAALYAAAEGVPPYDTDDNPVATINSVVNGPVPNTARPGPIGEVITALLVKDPRRRMSLREVRGLVQPLLPDPGAEPFAGLVPEESATVRTPLPEGSDSEPGMRSGSSWPAEPASGSGRGSRETSGSGFQHDNGPQYSGGFSDGLAASGGAPDESGSAPLAADPGPLPFTPSEPPRQRKRRSPLGVLLLTLAAVLLFVPAAGASFVGTRILAGEQVIPDYEDPGPETLQQRELVELEGNNGTLEHRNDGGGGYYSMPVPVGWSRYQEYTSETPTRSMTARFVSPGGRTELAVQRFGGYYERGYTTEGYITALQERQRGANNTFELRSRAPVGNDSRRASRDTQLTYNVIINSYDANSTAREPLLRHVAARLMPRGGDLWIVRVTTSATMPEAQRLLERTVNRFEVQS